MLDVRFDCKYKEDGTVVALTKLGAERVPRDSSGINVNSSKILTLPIYKPICFAYTLEDYFKYAANRQVIVTSSIGSSPEEICFAPVEVCPGSN